MVARSHARLCVIMGSSGASWWAVRNRRDARANLPTAHVDVGYLDIATDKFRIDADGFAEMFQGAVGIAAEKRESPQAHVGVDEIRIEFEGLTEESGGFIEALGFQQGPAEGVLEVGRGGGSVVSGKHGWRTGIER